MNVSKLHTSQTNTKHKFEKVSHWGLLHQTNHCMGNFSFTRKTHHIINLNCRFLDSVKSCSGSLFSFFWWWKQLCCWHTPDVMTPFPTRPNPLPVLNNSALPDVLLADVLQTDKEKSQQSKQKKGIGQKHLHQKHQSPFLNWIEGLDEGLTAFQCCTEEKNLHKIQRQKQMNDVDSH